MTRRQAQQLIDSGAANDSFRQMVADQDLTQAVAQDFAARLPATHRMVRVCGGRDQAKIVRGKSSAAKVIFFVRDNHILLTVRPSIGVTFFEISDPKSIPKIEARLAQAGIMMAPDPQRYD